MFQQRIFSNSNAIEPKGVDLTLPVSPTRKLDVANVTLRKYPLYTGNAETLAWEKYLSNQVPGKELNFIRDFYVNDKVIEEQDIRRFSEQIKDSNQQQQNSYDLAKFISKQIITDELIKQEKDQRNKKLVQARISQTLGKLKQQKNEEILKWKYGLKRLFHQMREAVEHILNAEGEKKFHRLHELIKQKAHITEVFLQGLPKRSAAEIQEITSNVRLLLSKKTDELNVLKQEFGDDYFDYDDKTIREMSRASSDTGSVMSERLTEIRQQNDKQKKKESEKKLEPFYDFKVLKEKWKTNDEEKVKGVIRRVIVKDCLMEAEHLKARAYRMNDKKLPVRPISQPKKSKTKKQVMVKSTDESAKKLQERKEKKIAQSQTQSFMSQTRQKYKREQQRQEFFSNYNLRNTIGEQFNAAVGYANLF